MTVSTEPRTGGRARRIVPLVVGTLVLLVLAVPALLGGGALVAVHATERDGDGFYATGSRTLATPTHALVSDGLDVGTGGPDWLFREGRLGTVRVTATGTSAKPVFVGVARRSQVDAYLRGVARDLITDFEVDPFTVASTRRPGAATPAAPTGQAFWAGQASGAGRQTLAWPVQEGDWAVVVMNADGSSDIRTDVTVGAKLGLLLWLGIALLAVGGILAAGAAALIVVGVRRPASARGIDPVNVPLEGAA